MNKLKQLEQKIGKLETKFNITVSDIGSEFIIETFCLGDNYTLDLVAKQLSEFKPFKFGNKLVIEY